ncbi:MAG: sulfurtransferase [Rhodospirillales bacterium]
MRNAFLKILVAAFIMVSATAAEAAETAFAPLISADQLAEARVTLDPLILDIRGDKAKDGYIPGAVSVDYAAFRGPTKSPGQLVSERNLTNLLQRLGVEADRRTVIVYQGADQTDFGAAARVYWTLKSAGVSELAILNGGMNAWTKGATRPISKTAATPTASDIAVNFSDTWLATREDVLAVVNGDRAARLIDGRPADFYNGDTLHPAAARPGTLPQSELFTHSNWFKDGPAIIDATAAQQLANENGFKKDDLLVSFCNTGHWAATNWFALSELAGIENVKLYPESMVGWSQAELPMANTPGLFKAFWIKIKQAI